MSKGLESLETLKFEWVDDKFFQKHELYLPKYENDYDEILKKVEEDEDYQIVEKELKALEIIRKNIGLSRLSEEFDYLLNNDEYKLLKEVLL